MSEGINGMPTLKNYDLVRIRQIVQSAESFNGWGVNCRLPAIGDCGVLLDQLVAPGVPDKYIVEMVDPDGTTIWLDTFLVEELDPLD